MSILRVEKELANVRVKFSAGGLDGLLGCFSFSGYSRKKYCAKLVYIFLLGYHIDFGFIEAVKLLSSQKYSEKFIVFFPNLTLGYMFCSLLLNDTHELVPLIVNSIISDLHSSNRASQGAALNV